MISKLKFWIKAKRIGPDMPLSHVLLYSNRLMRALCKRKFRFFGEGSSFRPGAYAVETNRISIGKHVTIRPNSMLFAAPLGELNEQIIIEDYALIGSGVHVYVSNHKFTDTSLPIFHQGHSEVKPVRICKGSWIGANVVILPGVTVGENSVVAAGSVVTKDIQPFCLYAGVPAKFIKRIESGS